MSLDDLYARIERLGLAFMTICLLVIPLSACGEAAPPPEPVTITFAYWESDTARVEALVQEFTEQYPHVTVDLRPESMGTLAWDLGAEDADVREVFVAIIDGQRERGDFLELDPFIKQDELFDLSDFYPATLETFTIEGKTWAIPYGVDSEVMYYNQDLFDQYGVPYPELGWTWDDFVSTAQAIRDPEAGVYGYACLGGRWSILMFVCQHGGRLFEDMQNPARTTFDDPLTVEALEWYGSLFHEYDVALSPRLRGDQKQWALREAILAGKVGMWSSAFSDQGGQDESWAGVEWPMRWGIVTFPRSTADTATGIVGDLWVNGYAISSQTQHPDVAWRLVAFLSRQMPTRHVPVRRSQAESEGYERRAGSDAAAVSRAVLENGLPYYPRDFLSRTLEALGILEQAAGMIELGARTPQEAMDWAQQEAETRIEP
jgi:multiple sugar transport system substrate-binding protein